MDFEDFEGYKEVKNDRNLHIEEIFSLLERYEENIGTINYNLSLDTSSIVIDVEGRYNIEIYLKDDVIVIQRKLEEGIEDNNKKAFEYGKTVELANTDRMIEQIFDMLNDYMPDETITEHITKAKAVYFMKELEETKALGIIPAGNNYIVMNQEKQLYTVKQNILNHVYTIKNIESKREEVSILYDEKYLMSYTITRQPFERIVLTRDETNLVKNIFRGKVSGNNLKISADYSNNHFLIELNEVVIGSVDCLDPDSKENYRMEINNFDYTYLVLATAVIADLFMENQKKKEMKEMKKNNK